MRRSNTPTSESNELFQRAVRVILGVFMIFIAVQKALEPHIYPSGDARNNPLLWILLGIVIGGIGLGIIASAFVQRLR
jgi:hypothetical protein